MSSNIQVWHHGEWVDFWPVGNMVVDDHGNIVDTIDNRPLANLPYYVTGKIVSGYYMNKPYYEKRMYDKSQLREAPIVPFVKKNRCFNCFKCC